MHVRNIKKSHPSVASTPKPENDSRKKNLDSGGLTSPLYSNSICNNGPASKIPRQESTAVSKGQGSVIAGSESFLVNKTDGSETEVLPEGITVNKIAGESDNYGQNLIINEQVPDGALHVGEIIRDYTIHDDAINVSGILTNKKTAPGPQCNSIVGKLDSKGNFIGFLGGQKSLYRAVKMPLGQPICNNMAANSSSIIGGENKTPDFAFANKSIAEIAGEPKQMLFEGKEDTNLNATNLAIESGDILRTGMKFRRSLRSNGGTNIHIETTRGSQKTTGMQVGKNLDNHGSVNITIGPGS